MTLTRIAVVALGLAVVAACGPRKAALGSSGGSSSSGASGSGSSSGAGQTGTGTGASGTSGTSGTTGSVASSDTGTAGATTGEPYMGPYHPCTKDEDCDDVVVDGVSGTCDIQPEGSICIPPYECLPGGGESGGPIGEAICPDWGNLECSDEAMLHPDYIDCTSGGGGGSCNMGEPPFGNVCVIGCRPPQYPCPAPLVCAILFDDWGTCVWPP